MATTFYKDSSSDSSPVDNDVGKGDFSARHGRQQEEVEAEGSHDDAETSIARRRTDGGKLAPALYPTRSQSSQRSYAGADGYTHFAHDEEEEEQRQGHESPHGGPEADEKAFEVAWDGVQDPMNPKGDAWGSMLKKWSIVCILAAASMCVTCASALYTSTYTQLEREFHISREAATVGLSIFVCGLGLGPMFLSPLSEFYGRRIIYLCAFGLYLIWLIPCAVAPNLGTMLVSRFFDGLAGSAFLSVAGGTVGDMFPKEKLSMPMVIYTASPFVGPLVGIFSLEVEGADTDNRLGRSSHRRLHQHLPGLALELLGPRHLGRCELDADLLLGARDLHASPAAKEGCQAAEGNGRRPMESSN